MELKFERIIKKLEHFQNISYKIEENILTVFPSNNYGFQVSFVVTKNKYYVYYDVWHSEFKDEDEAISCFAFGLTNKCRLRVNSRGSKDYKWILEYNEEGEWKEHSYTSVFNFKIWNSKNTRYLTNNLINSIKDFMCS